MTQNDPMCTFEMGRDRTRRTEPNCPLLSPTNCQCLFNFCLIWFSRCVCVCDVSFGILSRPNSIQSYFPVNTRPFSTFTKNIIDVCFDMIFQIFGEGVAVTVRANGKTTVGRARCHWKWPGSTCNLFGWHIDAIARALGERRRSQFTWHNRRGKLIEILCWNGPGNHCCREWGFLRPVTIPLQFPRILCSSSLLIEWNRCSMDTDYIAWRNHSSFFFSTNWYD